MTASFPACGSSSPSPLLDLQSITRTYAGPPRVEALRAVELTVGYGDFIAIEGPSGAGKSTLLNILGLLDRPSSGRYYLAGSDLTDIKQRERDRIRGQTFGFVFQDSHMLTDRTVAANVALALQTQKVPFRKRPRLVASALEAVGMLERAEGLARDLSGGERQRTALARAICRKPPILFADEPTGNLDVSNAASVIALLKEINAAGTTVVVITHDERVAASALRRLRLVDGMLTT